jgi:hypothetical protein
MAITVGELTSIPQWKKITKSYSDFSTGALTNTIDLIALPAKAIITGCVVKHSTLFSGGLIATYTISVGITGTLAKYAVAFDVNQAVSATASGVNILSGFEYGATTIKATAVSTVGQLNAATQGSVDIYLKVSIVP